MCDDVKPLYMHIHLAVEQRLLFFFHMRQITQMVSGVNVMIKSLFLSKLCWYKLWNKHYVIVFPKRQTCNPFESSSWCARGTCTPRVLVSGSVSSLHQFGPRSIHLSPVKTSFFLKLHTFLYTPRLEVYNFSCFYGTSKAFLDSLIFFPS